jgi:hypothetical protein
MTLRLDIYCQFGRLEGHRNSKPMYKAPEQNAGIHSSNLNPLRTSLCKEGQTRINSVQIIFLE